MFYINDIKWQLKFVPAADQALTRRDGSISIGSTDADTHTIYVDKNLRGILLKKVLCHELTHAAIFSYGIQLNEDQEEIIADLIATYGQEIIDITNKIFKKLKGEG